MILKRNLLTILYSVFFVALFGLGFLEVAYLAISNTDNQNIIACILVLGIIIYLITAFFIKESKVFQFLQENKSWLVILEALLAVVLMGGMFYLNMDKGIDNSLLIVLLLASIYLAARFQGERVCGIVALVLGFFFILSVAGTSFNADHYINTLCFLVPYTIFLFITKVLIRTFFDQGFILFSAYLALAVLFALAILLNPLVCALLFGCVFSLVFGKPERKGSKVASGPISAGLFVLFTALILAAANFVLQDIYILPSFDMDSTLLMISDVQELIEYLLDKYTNAVNYLYTPFEFGVFPAILLFLGCASGYYAIRKKASTIGPLCLTFIILLVYYLCFWENGSHFYYMTYFLPVFAAYGMYSTLLPERPKIAGQIVSNENPDDAEENGDGDTVIEMEPAESVAASLPESESDAKEKIVAEKERASHEAPSSVEVPPIQTEPVKKEVVTGPVEELPSAKKQKAEQNIIGLREKSGEEIPEWHVSESFLTKEEEESPTAAPEQTGTLPTPEPEPVLEPTLQLEPALQSEPAPKPTLQLEPAQESEPAPKPTLQLEPAQESEPALEPTLQLEPTLKQEDDNTIHPVNHTGENDIEQFLTSAGNEDSLSVKTENPEDDSQLNSLLNRLDISDSIRRMNETAREDLADVIEREEESIELSSAIPTESVVLSKPDVVEADVLEPDVLKPDVLEPDVLEPDVLEPDVLEPTLELEPDALEPALELESDVLEPDLSKPDSPRVNAVKEELTWDIDALTETKSPVEDRTEMFREQQPKQPEQPKQQPEQPVEEKTHTPLPKYEKPSFEFDMEPMAQSLADTDSEVSEYGKVPTINDLEKKLRTVEDEPEPKPAPASENGFAYSLDDVTSRTEKETAEAAPQVHSEEVIKRTPVGKRSYHRITIR
ncbi:MAG: hypothetical protein J1F02_03860 [Lachnospiraceae bacterium]|nr:hypothetical protein [Lachnospiraceae bacterium]